jgi:hypothetical protein
MVTLPGARRAHGLVGALAARRHAEVAAELGLARRGQMREFDDHIGVGAADDDDANVFHHVFSFDIGDQVFETIRMPRPSR